MEKTAKKVLLKSVIVRSQKRQPQVIPVCGND